MADLTVKTQAINATDLFLVQRPSDIGSGDTPYPIYSVSAEDIGIFSSNYIYTDFVEIKEEFKDIQNQLDMINNELLTTIKTVTTNHDIRITVLEDKTDQLILDIEETNTSIEDIVAKTRIYLYHRLVDYGGSTSEPGEMAVRKKDGSVPAGLEEVEIIEYFLSDTQNIANIFENEVLELTSQSGPTNENGYITHRAIYNIDYISSRGSIIEIEVTARNVSGIGFPYYQRGLLNEVRTDIYPVFTISQEEFETGINTRYAKTGGTITGNVIIDYPGTNMLRLKGTAGKIDFLNVLSFTREGNEILKLEQNFILAKKPINLNGNKIINLEAPSEDSSAVTKKYVDDLVAQNDITEDQLFSRGDAVSGQSSGTTKNGGFFYQNGSLYYKV